MMYLKYNNHNRVRSSSNPKAFLEKTWGNKSISNRGNSKLNIHRKMDTISSIGFQNKSGFTDMTRTTLRNPGGAGVMSEHALVCPYHG